MMADISPRPAGFRARATTMLVAAFSPRTRTLVASDCSAAAELLRPANIVLIAASSAVVRLFASTEATHVSGVMRAPESRLLLFQFVGYGLLSRLKGAGSRWGAGHTNIELTDLLQELLLREVMQNSLTGRNPEALAVISIAV